MAKTYTLPELLALGNDALNALAAGLRGWTLQAGIFDSDKYWVDGNGQDHYLEAHWTPSDNRNQSGELLIEAQKHGAEFIVSFQSVANHIAHTGAKDFVPGNDARAETVAFCAAMMAMQGRLSDG